MAEAKKQSTEVESKAQEYLKALQELDEKFGYTKIATPAWKLSQDTGVFSLVIQYQIAQLPKPEK